MTRCHLTALRVVATLALVTAPPVLAQSQPAGRFALATTDGALLRGEPLSFDPTGGLLRFQPAGTGRAAVDVPLDRILALHGPAPREGDRGVVVRLVGGDEFRGELAAGDVTGETLSVRSTVLGSVTVRLDRVRALALLERAGPMGIDRFVVPEDTVEAEALFLPARRGFDLVVGAVHRFRDDGVLFASRASSEPRLWSYASLAGFALRGGEPRDAPAPATLVTVNGDRIGAEWLGLDADVFAFRLEGGRAIGVQRGDVAALHVAREGVTFVSDLPVAEARERSYFADGDAPLMPFRLDRSVVGGPLSASGLGFGKGIGVQSRSALAWKVPDGARALVGFVALDDSVLGLPVRGAVDVRVRLGDEVLFEAKELASGQPPRPLGVLPVRPGGTLRLEVDFGPGLDLGDRVDWLDVAFLR